MVKWILYLLIAFLIIDHLWIHYGGPFIEKRRGEYREELKKKLFLIGRSWKRNGHTNKAYWIRFGKV